MTRTALFLRGIPVPGFDAVARTAGLLAERGVGDLVVVGPARDLGVDPTRARVRFAASGRAALRGRDGSCLVVLGDHIVAAASLERLLGARPVRAAVALVDDADRAFDPHAVERLDIDGRETALAGAFMAPVALAASADPLAALRRAARQGRVEALDADGATWHRVTDEASRRHAEWLLRVHGPDLAAAPSSQGREEPRTAEHAVEDLLRAKSPRPPILMTPGPVQTSARVKSALVHHDVNHRDKDFADCVRRLRRKLARIFRAGAEHGVLVLTGSGTAAMEAAIASTVPRDRRLLVASNGAFGERLADIARAHFLEAVHLRYGWGDPIDVRHVDRALAADPTIFAVAMVHHETSTGLLGPVGEVGAVCRGHDRLFIVDAVASLGGEDLDVVRDGIDVCLSSANKCLHGVAGVSFLCVHDRVWQRIAEVPPRGYYLDLRRYRRFADELGQTPFTPAVSAFYALEAAADELLADGLERRRATYRRRSRRLRAGLRELGFDLLTRTGRESATLTVARVPDGLEFADLYREMKTRGYLIYGCKGPLERRFFQVANMGELADGAVEGFLAALGEVARAARLRRRPPLRLVGSA